MPKRFKLNYIGDDGQEHEAVVIHRSSVGAIERFTAFLIEKYAGAFPLWIAPVQVKILPIGEAHQAYAREIAATLKNETIRVEVDESSETLGKKIRQAKTEKVPYLIVLGDKEVAEQKLTIESRDGGKSESGVKEFVKKLEEKIRTRN
jgi:threonyl-tRNA synthetase